MKNKYFIGLDEVSCLVNPGCDLGLNDDNIAFFASQLNAKTMRIWVRTPEIINVLENNQVEFKADGIIRLNSYLTKLKKAGVERFLLLDWAFVYPRGYSPTDSWVVPDPKTEKDMYIKFMRLQRSVHYLIASNFTEIEYFESTNEPDGIDGTFLHKNGYNLAKSSKENENYIYDINDIEDICLDLNFYSNEGIKAANKDAKMLFPSFWNNESAPDYIDRIYNKIESGKYPTIKKIGSTNIEDFFEIFSFHPYNLKTVEIDEYWEQTQTNLHNVMLKHKDINRKVWYTETGWSDFSREDEKNRIGDRFVKLFEVTQEKFPWVETVFVFRLFTLANRPENEGENNFGLVYNEYDWFTPLMPKDAFIKIASYSNSNYDENESKSLSKIENNDFFPSYELKGNKKKILVLGNKFSYQPIAKWNKWNANNSGLINDKNYPDWIHIINQNKNFSFSVKNIEKFEREIGYKPTIDKLLALKEEKPDITIIQLGDFFMPCNLIDHSLKENMITIVSAFSEVSEVFIIPSLLGNDVVNKIFAEVSKETNAKFIDSISSFNLSSLLKKTPFLNKDPILVLTKDGHELIAQEVMKLL